MKDVQYVGRIEIRKMYKPFLERLAVLILENALAIHPQTLDYGLLGA